MPTTPERLIEIATRHISHNERLKSHSVKEYSEFLEDMKNSVTNQLTNKDLTKFSRDRLLALEKNIASDLKEINQAAAGTLKSQARDLAKYESEFEVKALSDVVNHSFNLPSTTQLNSAVFKTPLAGIEGPMKGKLLDSVIRDWSDRTVDRVNNVITSGYYQGKTTAAIVKDVVGTGANFTGGSLAQVKRDTEGLVRTSLQHAANQARQETWNQNSDIVKGVRILATLDSKTSTVCRSLDGQVYALDEGPRPPFHINCLPGDTNISTCSSVSNVYKRPYKGILVDIQTISGYSLSITPNHPILTDSGWKAASDINCSDKLACVPCPHVFTKNNKDCVNTSFSKLFSTCKVSVNASFIGNSPSSPKDFHGDGLTDTNVSIINIDRFAWNCIRESFFNFSKNQRFPARLRVCLTFFRFCSFSQFFRTNDSTSSSIMCSFSKISNFFRRSIFHSFKLLFGGISKFTKFFFKQSSNRSIRTGKTKAFRNTVNPDSAFISGENQFLCFFRKINLSKRFNSDTSFLKNSANLSMTNAINLFDVLNRQSFDSVKFDNVVNVTFRQLTDFIHVYNLQNESNWYISNNIITHNCRTSTVSVLDERFKILDEGATRSARDPETGEVYKVDSQRTYYDWLKGQPANVQDSILGPTRGKLLRDGGLTSKRFAELQLSKNFQPMTLAEIKAIEPIAFEKAGIDLAKAGKAPSPIDLRYSPEGKGVDGFFRERGIDIQEGYKLSDGKRGFLPSPEEVIRVKNEYKLSVESYEKFGYKINSSLQIVNDPEDVNFFARTANNKIIINIATEKNAMRVMKEIDLDWKPGEIPGYTSHDLKGVLTHEIGHTLDKKMNKNQQSEWARIFSNTDAGDFPSFYAQESQFEFWAESVNALLFYKNYAGLIQDETKEFIFKILEKWK